MPRTLLSRLLPAALCFLTLLSTARTGYATDTDGAGDCARSGTDYGDAPEGFDAYPGVLGRFPTCQAGLIPAGGQEQLGCASLSTMPGAAAGYVRHAFSPGGVWLGCASGADLGIDNDVDGKSSSGGPLSVCAPAPIDCIQNAFGLSFGQDECYGDNDAGLVAPVSFVACATATITYRVNNCQGTPRNMFLNVLIDWNHDGDWNDAEQCLPSGACAPEWALKNRPFPAIPGCNQRVSPPFVAGTTAGNAWMRITISDTPVPDDFAWAGTSTMPGGQVAFGETEDYPVQIVTQNDCLPYIDFGDAPENLAAYSNGVVGRFPTCVTPSAPGTLNITANCPANSTVPGNTGFVRHVATAANPDGFWLGCPVPGGVPPDAIDPETDGKVNNFGGGSPSTCNANVITDCGESVFPGLTFGQDECYGDADAGVAAPFLFRACELGVINFKAYSCATHDQLVYVNILVDWNQDGDWNDNLQCASGPCAAEWAIKNAQMNLVPGCNSLGVTPFRVGPNGGEGWLRITITRQPVPNDFPWNGSLGIPGGAFDGGETEDYPVVINPPIGDPGPYNDRGDAPEGFLRYPPGGLGSEGHFPTCTVAAPASSLDLVGGCAPLSSPPGATGFVNHFHPGPPTPAAWLGCGNPGVDSEPDGKSNTTSLSGLISACDQTTVVDCVDNTIGVDYGADECPGDGDAGISTPFVFPRCGSTSFSYQAANGSASFLTMYLNVLVDWNDDSDWNDVDNCPYQGGCAPEWAVKNHVITLAPGCNTLTTPTFLTGRSISYPNDLGRWMRVTITFQPVNDDFPWAGSAFLPGQSFQGGETEDYVFYMDGDYSPCLDEYDDLGDAPENLTAYPNGTLGKFPTCVQGGPASTQTSPAGCPLPSTAPFAAGYIAHVNLLAYPPFWLGCASSPPPYSVDGEVDPKVNLTGAGSPGQCPGGGPNTDCAEVLAIMAPLTFGQDECYGDLDAGLTALKVFPGCVTSTFTYKASSCADQAFNAYLNVLVDWNHDGDWNDVERCTPQTNCAPEWAVKNHIVNIVPGCFTYTTPSIQAGGPDGPAWMRVTLTPTPVNNDFPWAGSSTEPPGHRYYDGGETEDYVVSIQGSPVDAETMTIDGLQLLPAMPNPARENTTARFTLPQAGSVKVSIYDAAGRHVRTLVNEMKPAGAHSVTWDYRDGGGDQAPAGVYLMQLQFAGRVLTQRIVRLP